jgi:hypothetical protein
MTCIDVKSLRKYKVGKFIIFDYLVAILSIYEVSQFFSISLLLAFIIMFIISFVICYYNDIKPLINDYFGFDLAPSPNKSTTTQTYKSSTPKTTDTSQNTPLVTTTDDNSQNTPLVTTTDDDSQNTPLVVTDDNSQNTPLVTTT